jgi:hypothetical protein
MGWLTPWYWAFGTFPSVNVSHSPEAPGPVHACVHLAFICPPVISKVALWCAAFMEVGQ